MVSVIALLLLAVAGFEGWVLYWTFRRLLQFDDLFQGIVGVLDVYSADLTRMTSADLDGVMVDHPEVVGFHRRNMRARAEVQAAIESITAISSRRVRKSDPKLPLPDME